MIPQDAPPDRRAPLEQLIGIWRERATGYISHVTFGMDGGEASRWAALAGEVEQCTQELEAALRTMPMKLRTATESVGWMNSVGPLTVSPSFHQREAALPASRPAPQVDAAEVVRAVRDTAEARMHEQRCGEEYMVGFVDACNDAIEAFGAVPAAPQEPTYQSATTPETKAAWDRLDAQREEP